MLLPYCIRASHLAQCDKKYLYSHKACHFYVIIVNLCPYVACLTFKCQVNFLFRLVVHFIRMVSSLPFTRVWNDKNSLEVKVIVGSMNISYNLAWQSSIAYIILMTKMSQAWISFIRFFTTFIRGTMQTTCKNVSTLPKNSKLVATFWFVRLSNVIFHK